MSQNTKQPANPNKTSDRTVEVLYQKMGDRWFAFSLINDEVFVGSISQEDLAANQGRDEQVPKDPGQAPHTYKITGTS